MDDLWNQVKDYAKAALPFVGGGLSFLGGLLTNESNADIARANRHFVRNMYKKRYQFTVDDMRKAGLNPVLAANGGSVGSVPSISTPTMSNALEAGVSGALSTARAVSDIHAQSVSNDKTKAEEEYAKANTYNVNARTQWQTIQNGILTKTEKALVKDAQARAVTNNALATLQRARAEHAQFLANSEADIAASNRDIAAEKAGAGRYDTMRKAREYEIMPKGKEGIFWDRLDRVSKAVGRGVNSALGVGKLKALSRAIR